MTTSIKMQATVTLLRLNIELNITVGSNVRGYIGLDTKSVVKEVTAERSVGKA